jgi:ribonuclease HI
LEEATVVTLENESALGEDRIVFPTDSQGVAQGSPLSPLFGNVLLREFDQRFNRTNLICVRFIDDFVLLGTSKEQSQRAFLEARQLLSTMNLKCHDPFDAGVSREKAQHGNVNKGFVFLGYDIRPGLRQPSQKARKNLLSNLHRHIQHGRTTISEALNPEVSNPHRQRYVQTLDLLDRVVRGWGDAFAYGNSKDTIDRLDEKVQELLDGFRVWYGRTLKNADWRAKRRATGICLLGDIESKSLSELPYRLPPQKKHPKTKQTILASTDGSVVGQRFNSQRDSRSGGWAVVFHENGLEFSGNVRGATNNQMELTAVIEALKQTPIGARITVRTDSQYVYGIAQENALVNSNWQLWKEFEKLRSERRVNIEWVKGHSGDAYNERADALANAAATSV